VKKLEEPKSVLYVRIDAHLLAMLQEHANANFRSVPKQVEFILSNHLNKEEKKA
jgi:hypothetical protein